MLHRGLRLGVQLCRQQDEGEGLAAAARRPGDVARGRAAADPRDVRLRRVRAAPSCSAFVPTLCPGSQCLLRAHSRVALTANVFLAWWQRLSTNGFSQF